jgi:hypothetical protein
MNKTAEKNLVRRIRYNLAPCMKLVRHDSGNYQVIDPRNGFMVDDDADLARLDRETKILSTLAPGDPTPDSLILSPAELEREMAKCRSVA